MAADVRHKWDGRFFRRGASGWAGKEEFDVIGVDNPADATAAVEALGIIINASNPTKHPKSDLVYLESLDPQPAGFGRWFVTANYASNPRGFHPNPGNPLNDPAIYRWEVGGESIEIMRDAYGTPIVNTALDLFDAFVSGTLTTLTFSVTRNEPYFNPALPLGYMNRVNSLPMTILGAWEVDKGQAKCRHIRPLTEASILSPFAPVEYLFELRQPFAETIDADGLWDSFKIRKLSEGRRSWFDAGGGSLTLGDIGTMINGGFTPVSMAVKLGPTGKPLGTGYRVGGDNDPVACPTSLPATVAIEPSTLLDKVTGDPIAYTMKFQEKLPVNFGDLNL